MSEEQFKVGPLTVTIEQDEHAPSPSEDGDTGLFLVANHRQFYVPPPDMSRCPESADEVVAMYRKTHWVFPLEAYIHSGVVLALSGEGNFPDRQWDVSRVGMVFASKKEWRLSAKARKAALNLIADWNTYLGGDVWCYTIKDEAGRTVDTLTGCFGLEETRKEAKASAEHYLKRQEVSA